MELQVTGCHCPHLPHRPHRPLPSHTSSIPSPLQRKDALLSELKAAELAASDPLRQADSLRASAAAVEAEGRNQRVALLATESNRALQAKLRRQEETVEQYQKMLTEARAALRREKASSAAESKRLSEQLYEQHEEGIQKLQKASASHAQPTRTRTAHHSPPLPTPGPHQARRGARAQAVGRRAHRRPDGGAVTREGRADRPARARARRREVGARDDAPPPPGARDARRDARGAARRRRQARADAPDVPAGEPAAREGDEPRARPRTDARRPQDAQGGDAYETARTEGPSPTALSPTPTSHPAPSSPLCRT